MNDERILSRAACQALADRIYAVGTGGGFTRVDIRSDASLNLRWARNAIITGGDTSTTNINLTRRIRGAVGGANTNNLTDEGLRDCVARAEALVLLRAESPDDYPASPPATLPHSQPNIWFDRTSAVGEIELAATCDRMLTVAERAGMLSAGYCELDAIGPALLSTEGLLRYYPYTTSQCSVTVRDQKARASGWAGIDWNDWTRINADEIMRIAIDKCQRSRNPVAVEPGRYTTILEPQAVCDLVAPIVEVALPRTRAERGEGPFADRLRPGYSLIGRRVADSRITLGADPMDPDCGFVPFDGAGEPYQKVNWIENGILKELAYNRGYGLTQLGKDVGLPSHDAFRLTGGTTTLEEMIASTARGVLVTRLNNVQIVDFPSMLSNGNTRDGLWLIEHGKITKPIKNFRFTESPLFALNNIEALGVPQRVFRPQAPAVVPPMMVRDFSFTALIDAV